MTAHAQVQVPAHMVERVRGHTSMCASRMRGVRGPQLHRGVSVPQRTAHAQVQVPAHMVERVRGHLTVCAGGGFDD